MQIKFGLKISPNMIIIPLVKKTAKKSKIFSPLILFEYQIICSAPGVWGVGDRIVKGLERGGWY